MARHGTLLNDASTPELPVLRSRILRRIDRRPSLQSAAKEYSGNHEAVAMQTATRAAAKGKRVLIRKMRPLEESHAFAFHNDLV